MFISGQEVVSDIDKGVSLKIIVFKADEHNIVKPGFVEIQVTARHRKIASSSVMEAQSMHGMV